MYKSPHFLCFYAAFVRQIKQFGEHSFRCLRVGRGNYRNAFSRAKCHFDPKSLGSRLYPRGRLGYRPYVRHSFSRTTSRTISERRGLVPRSCARSEEHTSELQSRRDLACRLLLEKKKQSINRVTPSCPTVISATCYTL